MPQLLTLIALVPTEILGLLGLILLLGLVDPTSRGIGIRIGIGVLLLTLRALFLVFFGLPGVLHMREQGIGGLRRLFLIFVL